MTQILSTRTVCCKLALDAAAIVAILATAEAFNAAATYCANVAWEEGVTNKNKLHHLVYGPTRIAYGLGAQLACCARDKAAEAVRAARANGSDTCPAFRPDSSIRYDARTYRLMSLDRVSLHTLTGRVVGQIVLGEFQRRYLYDTSWKVGGAELVIAVDPRNTSRTCAVCGHCEQANRPNQAHFKCLSCGHTDAADTNAAVNIAFRAARQTAYGVTPPSGGRANTSPAALALGI